MDRFKVNEKIRLEKIKTTHAPEVFSAIIDNKEYLRVWLPFVDQTKKVTDTEKFIKSVNEKPEGERDQVFVIKYENEFAGIIGFKDTDRINFKTELGYWIIEKMQRKGIITNVTLFLTDYAFGKMNMNRVQIKVAKGNSRSSAIPKRLNFKFEGVEREGEFHTKRYFDLEVYSILKKEWKEIEK